MDDHDLTSAWVTHNTAMIQRENRRRVMRAIGWTVGAIAAALLASGIFWAAIATAQGIAAAAPDMMRF